MIWVESKRDKHDLYWDFIFPTVIGTEYADFNVTFSLIKSYNYLDMLGTPATNVGMLDDLLIPPFLLFCGYLKRLDAIVN